LNYTLLLQTWTAAPESNHQSGVFTTIVVIFNSVIIPIWMFKTMTTNYLISSFFNHIHFEKTIFLVEIVESALFYVVPFISTIEINPMFLVSILFLLEFFFFCTFILFWVIVKPVLVTKFTLEFIAWNSHKRDWTSIYKCVSFN
jgi:hypothetical protein